MPRARDLGGFEVRRALPAAERQMVGPFIFFDQMGPAEFLIGHGHRRAPAPAHRPRHRDLPVRRRDHAPRQPRHRACRSGPGELNWMTAGRGIVHSERTAAEVRAARRRACSASRPGWRCPGRTRKARRPSPTTARASCRASAARARRVRVIMGSLYGAASPADFPHDSFYAEAVLAPGAVLPLDADYDERAVYIVARRDRHRRARRFGAGPPARLPPRRPHLDPGALAGAR